MLTRELVISAPGDGRKEGQLITGLQHRRLVAQRLVQRRAQGAAPGQRGVKRHPPGDEGVAGLSHGGTLGQGQLAGGAQSLAQGSKETELNVHGGVLGLRR